MALILQRHLAQQPASVARINRDSTLGAKLRYASTLGPNVVDITSGKLATFTDAPMVYPLVRGLGRKFLAANSQGLVLPTTDIVRGFPLTVAFWLDTDGALDSVIYSLNGTTYSGILGTWGGAWTVNVDSSATVSDGRVFTAGRQHIVVVHRNNSWSLYRNGEAAASVGVGSDYGQPAAGNHSIGYRLNGATPRHANATVQDFYVFEGELKPAEIKSLYANHWQVFEPLKRYLFAPPVAGYVLEAIGLAVAGGSATASVAVPLAAAGVAQAGGAAAGEIAITIGAQALATAAGAAGLDVAAVLAAVGAGQASGAAVLNVAITLAAAGAAQAAGTATISGGLPGELSASGGASASGSATATVGVTISAAGLAQAIGAGQLVVGIPLSAIGFATASGSAAAQIGFPPGVSDLARLTASHSLAASLTAGSTPASTWSATHGDA